MRQADLSTAARMAAKIRIEAQQAMEQDGASSWGAPYPSGAPCGSAAWRDIAGCLIADFFVQDLESEYFCLYPKVDFWDD